MTTIAAFAQALAEGRTTSEALVSDALTRIEAHRAAGGVAYISVDAHSAMQAARASDLARASGYVPSALAGLPVSIKDLFDVTGQVTAAGSRLLADAPPASRDAVVVERLRAAGAILLGRTNMSEFAFSGLGFNPHYGTPLTPLADGRVAGGSSSGAAVSVALGMAVAGLGTDTGGSIRIPAAFCNLTGFKPSASRVPMAGTFPLAESLDSVCALTQSVADCILLDQILSGEPLQTRAAPLAGLRLAVTRDVVLDQLDATVTAAFERSLDLLTQAGATVSWFDFPELHELRHINAAGGITAAEAWYGHRQWLDGDRADAYDPRVAQRIRRGAAISAADYLDIRNERQRLIDVARERLGNADAWLLPSVAVVPPRLADLADDAAFFATNALVLRNTSVINFLDGCALSLPCQRGDELPVGLSIAGLHGQDARVLQVSRSIEALLRESS
ncbi:amidase [Pseudomonas tolaasii]|uniref:Amidase n=2 Tax=Pseudomonas tolaasii TaxID=29442 RepID=A0A7Y8DSQ3_PSETO|nr:amidase [Pseudomonas tolaasii]ARB27412.1 amidase [Pseudomonas tolaasii]KAB0467481.1 amidase [Pseudomonas tolaasii]MBY8943309.1 amidase [Pseudomonas tolaasii]NWC21783.1 amidase [Pseudomonas tolaasii]NWC42666.1 amidase [Pseudomonas tolaasii]